MANEFLPEPKKISDQNFFSKNSKNVSPKNKTLKHKNINTIFLVAL